MSRPKLDANSETTSIHLKLSSKLLKQVNLWRRAQPDPIPNISESIRRLVDAGLEAEKKGRKK